jgi:hypothetical protein
MRRRVWETLKQPVRDAGEEAGPELLQRVAVPLVYLADYGRLAVYWASEISTVVIRARGEGSNGDTVLQAVRFAGQVLRDSNSKHMILDLLDSPDLIQLLAKQPWVRLTQYCDKPIVVYSGKESPPGWQVEPTFRAAAVVVRARGAAPDPTEPLGSLLDEEEADLIAGSYAGAVYWLPRERTVLFVWSGNDADQDGCRVLYAAASAYTQYLRIHAVICDVRHRLELDQKNQDRLRHFMDCAVFRGAAHCVLVGELRAIPEQEDPMHDYLDTLSLVSRVDFVDSFEHAQQLIASLPRARGAREMLDS